MSENGEGKKRNVTLSSWYLCEVVKAEGSEREAYVPQLQLPGLTGWEKFAEKNGEAGKRYFPIRAPQGVNAVSIREETVKVRTVVSD